MLVGEERVARLTVSFFCKHILRVADVINVMDIARDCGKHTRRTTLLFDVFRMLISLCKRA